MAKLMISHHWLAGLLLLLCTGLSAQEYSYFHLRGTYSRPHSFVSERTFAAKDSAGLFAKDGGGFDIEFGHYFNYWGLGGYYSFNQFGMFDDDFANRYGAISVQRSGRITSHAFAFGPTFSLPIINDAWYWHSGLYGGVRILSTPRELLLNYAPQDNRFTEVKYSGATNTNGFYALSTGFSLYFNEQVGLDFNGRYTGGGVHRFNYDYSGTGSKDVEGNQDLNQRVDFLSFQIGLTVKW
ncbi:MAG: hypothetical protein ACFB10_24835 [Salibacteraceae bacterium]